MYLLNYIQWILLKGADAPFILLIVNFLNLI